MVVSVVDESLGDAAEVFEGCVDGFGGAACGVGVVDVGQDVPRTVCEAIRLRCGGGRSRPGCPWLCV